MKNLDYLLMKMGTDLAKLDLEFSFITMRNIWL